MLYKLKSNKYILIFLSIYIGFNSIFLDKFPFVHSDEPWLSGLSRKAINHMDFSVTESFFDLYPRYPHGIKTIFHFLQGIVLKIFGYSIYNMRFISLLFGVFTLFLFYKIISDIYNKKFAVISTILLSVDIQFIYASHFARQEIVLLFMLLFAFYINLKSRTNITIKTGVITGIIIGLSIGIHPNSFVISIPFIFIYLYMLYKKSIKPAVLIGYISSVGIFALLFVLLSLSFNSNFFHDYFVYGQEFGVDNEATSKISQLKYFILKLYYGVSGTYYTPNIKFQFILFPLALIASIYYYIRTKQQILIYSILSILGIVVGTIIIGRYNQTSIIFLFPFFYLLIIAVIYNFNSRIRFIVISLLVITLTLLSYFNIQPYLNISYNDYLQEISIVVPRDSKTLANLNTEYYFDEGKLLDYRNLAFLKKENISFSDYISDREIKYIIYSSEMNFIYNTRPLWNGIYGNIYPYHEDMLSYFEDNCSLIKSFPSNYSMRISRYFLTTTENIYIYKVDSY